MKLQSTLFSIILLTTYLSLTASAAVVSDAASSSSSESTKKRPLRSLSEALGNAFKFPKLSETQSHWLTMLFFPRRSSQDSNNSEVSSSSAQNVPTESEDTNSDNNSEEDIALQYENNDTDEFDKVIRYSPPMNPLELEIALEWEKYKFPGYPADAEAPVTKDSQVEQVYEDSILSDEMSSFDDAKYMYYSIEDSFDGEDQFDQLSKAKGTNDDFETVSLYAVQSSEQAGSDWLLPVAVPQQLVPDQIIPTAVEHQVVPVVRY